MRAIAALAVTAVTVCGCALVEHPDATLSPPPVACAPASAIVSTGALEPGTPIVTLAELAGFHGGQQSTPSLVSRTGITVAPDGVLDGLGGSDADWVAAIRRTAGATQTLPDGFADEGALGSLGSPLGFPVRTTGSGTYVFATIAATRRLDFTVRCVDGRSVSGALSSPIIDEERTSLTVDCEAPGSSSAAALAFVYCQRASGKDPDG